jgi:hypothetical protein
MHQRSQNIQGNHVAINDCAQVFRLREPRGDRACIWEAEDGTDHALIGLDDEDLVVEAKYCEDGEPPCGLDKQIQTPKRFPNNFAALSALRLPWTDI